MPVPRFLAQFDVSLLVDTPGGPVTATGVGAVRWRQGVQPDSRPPTVNRYANPSFGTNVTGTAKAPLEANSAGRVASPGYDGTTGFIRPIRNGASAAGFVARAMRASVQPGEELYCGVAVRAPTGVTVNVYLEQADKSGAIVATPLVGSVVGAGAAPGTSWVYVDTVFTVPAGTAYLSHYLTTTGDQFDADSMIIASDTEAYFDGGSGAGYRWENTAHASQSYREGWAFGGALLLEEATTNVVPNPIPNSAWVRGGGGSTHSTIIGHEYGRSTQSTDDGISAVPEMRMVDSTVMAAPAPGDPIAASGWIFPDTDDATVNHRLIITREVLSDVSNTLFAGSVIGGQWNRTISIHTANATATGIRSFWSESLNNQRQVNYAEAQLEHKDHATSFCPELTGTSTPNTGYAWSGTAHASASTRAASSVSIPMPDPVVALALWYSEDFGNTWAFAYALETAPGSGLWDFGTYGGAELVAGDLVFTTGRALLLGPVMGLPVALSTEHQDALAATTIWTLDMLPDPIQEIGGISSGLSQEYLGGLAASRMADIGGASDLAGEYIGGVAVEERTGL